MEAYIEGNRTCEDLIFGNFLLFEHYFASKSVEREVKSYSINKGDDVAVVVKCKGQPIEYNHLYP